MYSRRLKLNKKKPKPSRQKQTPGSNWGPRLALIERERALAGGGGAEDDEDEELYEVRPELLHNIKKPPSLAGGPGPGKHTQVYHSNHHLANSNGRSNSEVDPVLRLGRSSSPNYFYYNYSRRTAPNAGSSSQSRKISCPDPSSAMIMQQQQQKSASHLQNQQHQRRASYVLGSSSGYCSGSVTTLSTCANNNSSSNFEHFTKPLTLIIPSQERYDDYGGRTHNGGAVRKNRQRTHRDECEDFGTEEQSQDSFPSSSAYQSSENDDEGIPDTTPPKHHKSNGRNVQIKRQFHNPMANMMRKSSVGGILQISTQEVVQVHAPPVTTSPPATLEETATEPETLEIGAGECGAAASGNNNSNNSKTAGENSKTGSTITALAHGITMVYVPMAETSTSPRTIDRRTGIDFTDSEYGGDLLPDYNEHVDLPELGRQSDDCSASTGSSSRESGKGPEDSLTSNFILKRKEPTQNHQRGNGVGDSLLDSFESVLFKPKPGEALQKSQERCRLSANESSSALSQPEHKGIRKRPEQPPPLPPTEGSKPTEKQKNLRFALENLETVLNPSLPSSVEEPQRQQQQSSAAPTPAKKVLKKVTLSLPGADNISSRNHELLLNYEELNTCSSEILSCGHVRSDDYSTLSSLTSSAQEISDFDEIGSNQGNNSNAGDVMEESSNNGVSSASASGGESDAGSGSNNSNSSKPRHEPRSVLQQLRDLSRLIRGNSPTKPQTQPKPTSKENSTSKANNDNSFYLHNEQSAPATNDTEVAKRKTSDATDNSADSGKGSGSGTSGSGSGSSGQEASSSSAEPSPNNSRGGPVICTNKAGKGSVNSVTAKLQNNRRLKIATIRGRGGGTGNHHHYSICADEHCQQGEDSVSQRSSCSCQDCCDYRSDCTECVLYSNKSKTGFPKPSNSQELCNHETGRKNKIPPPPHKTRPVVSKIVRRTSSRARASASARRSASLKRSAKLSQLSSNRKPVILDYCDCSNCDVGEFEDYDEEDDDGILSDQRRNGGGNYCVNKGYRSHHQPQYHEPLLIPVNTKVKKGSTKCKSKQGKLINPIAGCSTSSGSVSEGRKVSSSSASSGVSSSSSAGGKFSRISALRSSSLTVQQHLQATKPSQLLRQSDAASTGAAISSNPISVVPIAAPAPSGNLFTIDEANEDSVYGESGSGGAVILGNRGRNNAGSGVAGKQHSRPRADFHLQHQSEDSQDDSVIHQAKVICGSNTSGRSTRSSQHAHPKCWLAPDATLGWSDLESLYSQNMNHGRSRTPAALRDECPTCWKELSEMKKNCPDPNRTVDRTKRMFIWLNRRHKEFHAPWWEVTQYPYQIFIGKNNGWTSCCEVRLFSNYFRRRSKRQCVG